jgi:uncharacterized membrane protein YdjX (TVP38/TMEM64 family)
MRLLLIFLILATIVLTTFFIWGDAFMTIFTHDGTIAWLKNYGQWAWAIAIILLMCDLLLPLPATMIMTALGFIYGPVTGGLIAVAGSFMAGSLGYWLCRLLGENTAMWLLGKKDYERGKKMATNVGGLIVALSRWLPVFPEVVACMAGLTRMSSAMFHVALLCGSLPLGFIYALVGYSGNDNPVLAFILSAIVPVLIWLGLRPFFRSTVNESR